MRNLKTQIPRDIAYAQVASQTREQRVERERERERTRLSRGALEGCALLVVHEGHGPGEAERARGGERLDEERLGGFLRERTRLGPTREGQRPATRVTLRVRLKLQHLAAFTRILRCVRYTWETIDQRVVGSPPFAAFDPRLALVELSRSTGVTKSLSKVSAQSQNSTDAGKATRRARSPRPPAPQREERVWRF